MRKAKSIPSETERRTLRLIQYLRAAAAVMVTIHHATAGVYGGTRIPALHGSVDMFFVVME